MDTDTEALVNELISSYEKFTGRTLFPADPVRLFILWMADIIIQERIIINESAKQNVPRYAEGDNLDSLGEIFNSQRLEAQPAKTTLRFWLSSALPHQQLVPQGTRVTVDGSITFETIEPLYIFTGSLYGDVAAKCQAVGTIGNGFVPGQIKDLVDIFPYFKSVENITESDGGAEVETDESFYERMRESMEGQSTAGPEGSYIYFAKTASPLIADVAATSPERGTVDIRVLLRNGELPTEEVIKQVETVLSAETQRPLTDKVQVSAPDTVGFDVRVTYYIANPSKDSAAVIAEKVESAVDHYIAWQTEKMGRDINPSYLIALLMATGIKRVEVTQPGTLAVDKNKVAHLGTKEIAYGGLEDE